MSTFMANKANIERKWYILDAAGKPLGKTAVRAADLLRGKTKVTYTPNADCGDNVIIINAGQAVLTGKKPEQKIYRTHSGWIGGLKETKYRILMQEKPETAMRVAVRGMMPRNTVCRQAPAHIGHGSNVTTSVQSARFQVSSEAAASAIALTSAWASGSACVSRRFRPRPITCPSAASTTAPTGTSPSAAASRASAIAGSISSSHRIRHSVAAAIRPLRTTGPHVRPACPTCAPNRSGTNVSPWRNTLITASW